MDFKKTYDDAKAIAPDTLLIFENGAYYETFYDDARTAAKVLGLTLTTPSRNDSTPMTGLPYIAIGEYVAKFLRLGIWTAIIENKDNPAPFKKLVNA